MASTRENLPEEEADIAESSQEMESIRSHMPSFEPLVSRERYVKECESPKENWGSVGKNEGQVILGTRIPLQLE